MASTKSAAGQLQWFGDALSSDAGLRSKSLKVVQYSAKLYVWAHANGLVSPSAESHPPHKSAKSLAKSLGSARKVMNLGDCISDFFEMRERVRSAWADPGSPDRVRAAVRSVSDFVCDATTDWILVAGMVGKPDSVPDWVERTNDVSWGVGAALSVIAAARKLQQRTAARLKAEASMHAARAAGRAAEERLSRSSGRGDVSPMRRRAAAHSSPTVPGATPRPAQPQAPTASVLAARRAETLAAAALVRAACELLQAGPGVFGLDAPSELLYLLAGLANGVLGVWIACESAAE